VRTIQICHSQVSYDRPCLTTQQGEERSPTVGEPHVRHETTNGGGITKVTRQVGESKNATSLRHLVKMKQSPEDQKYNLLPVRLQNKLHTAAGRKQHKTGVNENTAPLVWRKVQGLLYGKSLWGTTDAVGLSSDK